MNDLNSAVSLQIAADLKIILQSGLGNVVLAVVLIRLSPGSVNIEYQTTLSNPVTPEKLQEAVVNGQKNEINNLGFITNIDPNSINFNETVQTPCTPSSSNRTEIILNGGCGDHSETGICMTPNSACVERSGIWSCRCESGYVQTRDQRTCTPAPRDLFAYRNLSVTLQVPKEAGTQIFTIPFSSEVANLCAIVPEVTFIKAFTENNFRYEVNCSGVTVILDSFLSGEEENFALGVQTKMSFSDLVVSDKIVTILETSSNVSIPSELCVTVTDGTFSGQLLAELPPLPSGNSYSATSPRYMLIGESVYSRIAINLTTLTGQTDIAAYMDRFDVTYGSRTIAIKLVIVRAEIEITKPEDVSISSVVLEYSISDSFTLSTVGLPSTNLTLRSSDVRVGPGRLDFESGMSPITFNIEVNVCSLTASTKVTLHITDTNDNPPQFSSDTYSFDIFPTSLPGLLVGVVTATDIDTMTTMTFSIDSPSFNIDNTGVIKTAERTEIIPFIAMSELSKYASNIHLNVTASDGLRSSKVNVFVNLARQPGTNLGKTFSANVLENSPVGTYVGTANVSDYTDFEFASSRAEQFFFLNGTSGEIFTNKGLDRENENEKELHFSITAFKSSETTCSLTVLGDLEVTVDDVNDNAPVFEQSNYEGEIQEGSVTGRTVKLPIAISATDADENPAFTFAISGSDFTIDPQTGVITTVSQIDREATDTVVLTVTADDGENTGSVSITISVTDVNDNQPSFTGDWRSSSISEGATVGEVVTTVTANDPDIGENGRLFYSIQGDSGYFRIENRLSGKITVAHVLDRETKPVHSFTVLARDNGNPPLSVNTTMTVNLLDINDNDPVFDEETLVVKISEAACEHIGVSVFNVSANDADESVNGAITAYSFTGGNDDGFFAIDAAGVVSCSKGLDYETTTEYKLVTLATDGGNPPRSSSATVTVSITDVNDNTPAFKQELATGTHFIRIGKSDFLDAAGKPVMVVTVMDADSGVNGQINTPIAMALSPGLSLSLNEGGVLRTISSDPPIQNLTATFTATDRGNPPLTATATLTLEIVPDSTTQEKVEFNVQDIPMAIEENTDNLNIGTLSNSITTPTGSTPAVFDKVSGAENVKIDSTGIVKVDAPFDRETTQSTVLIVRATVDDLSDLALVTLTVIDKNDNPPTFGSIDKYRQIVPEDTPINSGIVNVSATDKDAGINKRITYSVIGSEECSSHFIVNSISGKVSLSKNLDREVLFRFCSFSIQATDGGSPSFSAVVPIEVTVLDVNDNRPLFSDLLPSGKYEITVKEDFRISDQTDPFGRITDDDIGENGDVDIALAQGTSCPFTAKVEIATGDVFKIIFTLVSELDYEQTTGYECEVVVSDKGTPTLNNTVNVKVTVTDVNDNSPVFTITDYAVNVSRDAVIDHVIIDEIRATDAESTDIRFSLASPTSDDDYIGYFSIDFVTARITVNSKLVNLQKDDLLLYVIAADRGVPSLSATATLSIVILDDNIRPEFQNPVVSLELTEHSSVVNPIFIAEATDRVGRQGPDICNCVYRFQTISDTFDINNTTGRISVKTGVDLDREKGPNITVYVIATDPGNKDSLPFSLTIILLDINDQSPVFTDIRDGDYTFNLLQASPSGSHVGTVTAEDADDGENAVPVYSLRSARYSWSPLMNDVTELFQDVPVTISPQNGSITTNASIDLNATRNFFIELVVRAEDSKDSLKVTETKVLIEVNYLDPNRHHPTCSQGLYRTSLAKTSNIGTILDIIVNATDLDTGTDGVIAYTIAAGNVRDIFSIDSVSGQISVSFLIDLSSDIVNLTIQATDGGNIPKTGSCYVEIHLTGDAVDCKYSATGSTEDADKWFVPMVALAAVLGASLVALFVIIFKFVQLRFDYQDSNNFDSPRNRKKSIYTASLGASRHDGYNPYTPPSNFPGTPAARDTQGSLGRSFHDFRYSDNSPHPYRGSIFDGSSIADDYDRPDAPPLPRRQSHDSYSGSARPRGITFRDPDRVSFRNSTLHEPFPDY